MRVFFRHVIILFLALLACIVDFSSIAQTQRRSGAHSTLGRDTFTPTDRASVERAIGVTCAERVRDPLGSMPIDEMQTRPSLSVKDPDAVAGALRAERLLPITRKLVVDAIAQLAKDYDLNGSTPISNEGQSNTRRTTRNSTPRTVTLDLRSRVNAAAARVQAVRRIKPDVDARDNASVLLRDPHVIDFGTIFLAGLRSDEAMIGVLAHELTHIASGQTDSLRPLFRAIARRAAARTGLRITGQRAEELGCDLVGVLAARAYIKQTPSWEPLRQRLARTFEHNCVDDDASDEDHLSPRNTIRALLTLNISLANEMLNDNSGTPSIPAQRSSTKPISLTP